MGIHPSPPGRRIRVTVVSSCLATTMAVVLLWALPGLVGVSWRAIGAVLAGVSPLTLVALAALWFVGLLAHTPLQIAALKGLSVRRALTLNLSGSAVSNVLPFGGPAGMGVGYAMTHRWGFRSDQFASYTVTTNAWNAFGKFAFTVTVLLAAGVSGMSLPSGLARVVVPAAAMVAAGIVVLAATLGSTAATARLGRALDRVARRIRPQDSEQACTIWLFKARGELAAVVRGGWRRMTAAVLVYLVLQLALLFACLATVGAHATLAVTAVAFALERLISLAPITPGASGLAELGTVAALVSFGVDPVAAAAGVLLYRTLMFAIEIPLGGITILGWLRLRRRDHTPAGAPEESDLLATAVEAA